MAMMGQWGKGGRGAFDLLPSVKGCWAGILIQNLQQNTTAGPNISNEHSLSALSECRVWAPVPREGPLVAPVSSIYVLPRKLFHQAHANWYTLK